jgi:hypothetical protein
MRTAAICPTCATYTNAVCVLYDGPYLSNLDIAPLTDLEEVIGIIDAKVATLEPLLGFTPENVANKSTNTSLGTSNTLYPTQNAVKTYVDSTMSVKQVKVSLSSAQILTLGSVPVTLVAAQGAGKVIIPVSVVMNYNFVTSAYSTVTNLFITSSSSPTSITRSGVLAFVSDACTFDAPINSGASNALTGNEALTITTTGGNPTGGDSTLDVYVSYIVITI